VLSERKAKWLLNLFPPYLFSRTRLVRVAEGFRACRVQVTPSLLTRNLQGTMFGGTIFSAADPFFAILYWQYFAHRGLRLQAWVKSATVQYRRPAASKLTLDFELSEEDFRRARGALERDGRYSATHRTEAVDSNGTSCAIIDIEVYLRFPPGEQTELSAF
jgi:acyl-coenzyme A thioesterase PaaI-like protein